MPASEVFWSFSCDELVTAFECPPSSLLFYPYRKRKAFISLLPCVACYRALVVCIVYGADTVGTAAEV